MTTQLYRVGQAAVTIRDPDVPIEKAHVRLQAQNRALDGTLHQHIATLKWRWNLAWGLLTSAEYTTLITELERTQTMTFKPPDTASTYTVVMASDIIVGDDEFGSRTVRVTLEEA